MTCPNCNKNDTVTIGQKNYCTNCGTAIPAAGNGTRVSDLAPKPAAQPTPSQPTPKTLNPIANTVVQPKPAQQFHGAPSGRGTVLDLRSMPQPAPKPVTVKPEVTAAINTPDPDPGPAPGPQVIVGSARKEARQATASTVTKSEMVQKFPQQAPATSANQPASIPSPAIADYQPLPSSSASATAGAAAPTPPAPNRVPTSTQPQTVGPQIATPDIAGAASRATATPPPAAPQTMPNQVASQVNAMQNLISADALSNINPSAARKEAFKLAMDEPKPEPATKSGPRALSVAAAAFAVLIMGGYIWLQNYPKLAIRVAGNKAGIEASLPGYIPASYNLSGPITYSPGQITLTFSASGSNGRLTISERQTQWDSGSLLENYVSRKTKDYLAVQNQGLTIYLYNGNQASWVNRGIWYSIEGDSQLNREQVLKIASSL